MISMVFLLIQPEFHYLAWKRLADQLGIKFTEEDNERLKGVSRMDSLEIILEIGQLNLSSDQKNEYAALKNQWYVNYISRMTPDEILPGSREFLEELRAAGIRTGNRIGQQKYPDDTRKGWYSEPVRCSC
ncbi:MAG: hypothetical protein MZV63_70210 [Marinilabiliales bacterium]|nr:hypothetical protein [Marinilabiliales bacterium]